MNITPIRNQAIYNINFKSKVVETKYGNVPAKLQSAIDEFEETDAKNAKMIGEGLSSTAYKLNGTNCVIKVSKPCEAGKRNGDFSSEAKSLQLVPDNFKQAQRLIGSARTEKNNWYLITTYVNGKVPDGKEFKWDKKALSSALDAFAQLDINHVYHGDLARSNCLVTNDDDIRLLDFQFSRKFNFSSEDDHRENAGTYKVPYFIAPSNAQMFEGANFATYLTFLDDTEARKTFYDYISEKANYHKKRAEAFEKEGAREEIVDYEKLCAKFLKHPTKEVLDLCARKMEILLLHRYANASVEGFYNRLAAPSYYLQIIDKSNKMIQAAINLQNSTGNPELKRFCEFQKKDGEFWRDSMANELDGRYDKSSVFRWVVNEAQYRAPKMRKDVEKEEYIQLLSRADEYVELPNLHKILTEGVEKIGLTPLNEEDEVSSWIKTKANELRKTSNYYCIKNSREYKEINDYFEDKKAIIGKLNKAHEAYLTDKNYKSLFYGLEAFYDSRNLKSKAEKIAKQPYLRDNNKEKMAQEAEFLETYTDNMKEMNEWMYGRLLQHAYPNDPAIK